MNTLVPVNYQVREYKVLFSPGAAVDVECGIGMDLNDPLFPQMRQQVFDDASKPHVMGLTLDSNNDLISSEASVFQSESVREETRLLAASFAGKYGIVSGEAAYQKASRDLQQGKIFYIEIAVKGEGQALKNRTWASRPNAEEVDEKDRARQFLDDYGSHYIARLYFGKRIVIRATFASHETSEVEKFSVALKAAASTWSAGGSITNEHQIMLSDKRSEVRMGIVSGGLSSPGAEFALNIKDALELLGRIRNGEIVVSPGPLEADLMNFWHTLTDYPKSRAIFDEKVGQKPNSPFGVPKGTVIAWSPSENDWRAAPNSNEGVELVLPEGWAVCDGNGETPDLLDRFIFGRYTKGQVRTLGGNLQHSHRVSGATQIDNISGGQHGFWAVANGPRHAHQVDFESGYASSLPPYTCLVFLMKT